MPRVISTLPNQPSKVNGFAFAPQNDGQAHISEDMPQEHAEYFASIPGYSIEQPPKPAKQTAKKADGAAEDKKGTE